MIKTFNSKKMKLSRRNLRCNPSIPEQIFWKNIKNKQTGYKFRRQHSIGNYVVDFYSPELNLVIEIDGDSHVITEEVKLKDKIREEYLKSLKLNIKRYENRDVLYNLKGILEDLYNFLPPPTSSPLGQGESKTHFSPPF